MNGLPASRQKKSLSFGFTLIELLISMVIFAVLAVMAYGGLAAVIKASTGVQSRIEKLESLQKTFMLLERDIRQLVLRPVASDAGGLRPALEGGLGDALLEFTRGGYPNPADENRSSLLRVVYTLENGERLIRDRRSYLDQLSFTEKTVHPYLLDNVDEIVIRFLDNAGKWQSQWGGGNTNTLPTAVEITLKHKEWGEIRRLIPVYGY